MGLELVDHILCHAVCLRQHRRVVISNLSIDSETPLYYSHLENGAIYFVQNDMTHKSYEKIKPELDKARDEFGADKFIEGEAKGIDKRNIEIVKEMLNKNMDINLISELTKLSIEEIEKINTDRRTE